MKVGIIGAPGSGKSDFADDLTALYREAHPTHMTAVVDGYVERIEDEHDVACGMWGSYVADVSVAMERYGIERSLAKENTPFVVTCGTLIDTATHTAVNYAMTGGDWAWAVSSVVMPFYSLFAKSTLDYDHIFMCPLHPEDESEFAQAIDAHLMLIAEQFGIKPVMTDPREAFKAVTQRDD